MVSGLVVILTMAVAFAAMAAAALFVYVAWRFWPANATPRAVLPQAGLLLLALGAFVVAVDLIVGAFGLQAAVAAVMLVAGLGGFAVLGYRYREAGWLEETTRLSRAAGRWPWVLAGLVWLGAWSALALSTYEYKSEPSLDGGILVALLTVAIVPPLLGLLAGLGLLGRNHHGSDDHTPPLGRA